MKRTQMALTAVGCIGLAVAGNALVLSPRAHQRSEVKTKVAAAEAAGQELAAELASLRAAALDQPGRQDQIARLAQLVPADADMAAFIRSLDDVAAKSQVAWATLNPGATTAGPGGSGSIGISITLSGTFFQILDYLHRLESLERLVVLDTVRLASNPTGGGSPQLKANLEGRIFTATGGSPLPGAPRPGGVS